MNGKTQSSLKQECSKASKHCLRHPPPPAHRPPPSPARLAREALVAELASAQPSRQRVDQLVDELLGTSEPFDEQLIGGGPWQVGGHIALAGAWGAACRAALGGGACACTRPCLVGYCGCSTLILHSVNPAAMLWRWLEQVVYSRGPQLWKAWTSPGRLVGAGGNRASQVRPAAGGTRSRQRCTGLQPRHLAPCVRRKPGDPLHADPGGGRP